MILFLIIKINLNNIFKFKKKIQILVIKFNKTKVKNNDKCNLTISTLKNNKQIKQWDKFQLSLNI